MAWLDEYEFRALYVTDATSDLPSATINNALESAINHIADYVGDATITEVQTTENNSVLKVARLREAQELLTLRKILDVNLSRLRNGGVMDTERDENGNATNKYASFSDVEKRRDALLAEAQRLIRPYQPVGAAFLTSTMLLRG